MVLNAGLWNESNMSGNVSALCSLSVGMSVIHTQNINESIAVLLIRSVLH